MFFRILIWSVVFFFLIRFIWRIVAQFLGPPRSEQPSQKMPDAPQKPKEEFKDVRDAKFVDVPKSDAERSGEDSRD